MDLRALETFQAVVATGGIGRAAAKLHRAQSSVTSRIHQLELSLGVQLFHREGQRLHLTASGEALVDYAGRMLELAEQTRAAVRDNEAVGQLRLGAMESVAASRLPYPLAEFHRQHPQIAVNLQTASSRGLVADVQAGALDAAIVGESVDTTRFRSVPLYVEELVLVAARGSELLREPKQLAEGTVLVYHSEGCAYRRRLGQWLEAQHIVPARMLEFASYHGIFAAAAAGVGASLVPRSVLEVFPQRDALSVRDMPPRVARLQTALVMLRTRHLPVLAKLEACLREDAAAVRGGTRRGKRTRG
ncbi:LysR substrate-binding domain-containing protein [Rhodanobacter sp. 115]|uniref:LysR substrate-binding domain-containing protein n=1 Tax=Rhodanobacter sp. FW021-MT20 TaxID=1162282 RepID=UPI000260E329|nr:LysR substrate-binding domain-containing protein [Rhodanobacter sp. 115]EIM02110.1 LysR family transcriptional regulator [Rhodanobacter sp. 115]